MNLSFVQAEQCLCFIQKAYPLFLFGKAGEQGAGMQRGHLSCIQKRVLRRVSGHHSTVNSF